MLLKGANAVINNSTPHPQGSTVGIAESDERDEFAQEAGAVSHLVAIDGTIPGGAGPESPAACVSNILSPIETFNLLFLPRGLRPAGIFVA